MNKVEYLIRTLSKTNRKNFENYVINAIWHKLSNPEIEVVTQQFVKSTSNNMNRPYFFIDLYFPSINMGIECQECYHEQENQIMRDADRTIKIYDVLSMVKQDSFEQVTISQCKTIAPGKKERCSLEELDAQINAVVDKIKNRFETKIPRPTWKIMTEEEYFINKESINLTDPIRFKSINKVCNVLFNAGYSEIVNGPRNAYFSPSSFRGTHLEQYKLWFPRLAIQVTDESGETREISPNANQWRNRLIDDGKIIAEMNEGGVTYEPDGKTRIVFMKYKDALGFDGYKFLGVFKFKGNKNGENHFERVATEIKLLDFGDCK